MKGFIVSELPERFLTYENEFYHRRNLLFKKVLKTKEKCVNTFSTTVKLD